MAGTRRCRKKTLIYVGHMEMSRTDSVAQAVKDDLKSREPLDVLSLGDFYSRIDGNKATIRAALYGCTAGNKVSRNRPPSHYYAIQLPLELASGETGEIFLSLPEIPRELVELDAGEVSVQSIINSIQDMHGREVIDYWGKAAQRRSVDLARSAMVAARSRSGGSCRLCLIDGAKKGDSTIRGSYMISRKAVFWKVLQEVQVEYHTIFTNEAVLDIKSRIASHRYHSDPRFMIALCLTHERLLTAALKGSVVDT